MYQDRNFRSTDFIAGINFPKSKIPGYFMGINFRESTVKENLPIFLQPKKMLIQDQSCQLS